MTLSCTALTTKYQVHDVEFGNEVATFVSDPEVVPLRETFGVQVVLQDQVVTVAVDLCSCPCTL